WPAGLRTIQPPRHAVARGEPLKGNANGKRFKDLLAGRQHGITVSIHIAGGVDDRMRLESFEEMHTLFSLEANRFFYEQGYTRFDHSGLDRSALRRRCANKNGIESAYIQLASAF